MSLKDAVKSRDFDWTLGVPETNGIPPELFFNGPIPDYRREIIARQQAELRAAEQGSAS